MHRFGLDGGLRMLCTGDSWRPFPYDVNNEINF